MFQKLYDKHCHDLNIGIKFCRILILSGTAFRHAGADGFAAA
jgi:hypothetical protein